MDRRRRPGGGGRPVSNPVLNLAWQVEGLTASEKLVLVALADRADDAGSCWPSLADIARRCCISGRFVRVALRSIEAAGHVTTQRCAGPKGANLFRVHPRKPGSSPETHFTPPGSRIPPPPEAGFRQTIRESSGNLQGTPKPIGEASKVPSKQQPKPTAKPLVETRITRL